MISELRRALASQEENEKYLKEEMHKYCEKINEYEREKQQSTKRQTVDKDSQRVSILEDIIVKKDKELAKLHNKQWREQENKKEPEDMNTVTMTKSEYEGIMAQLKAYTRKTAKKQPPSSKDSKKLPSSSG